MSALWVTDRLRIIPTACVKGVYEGEYKLFYTLSVLVIKEFPQLSNLSWAYIQGVTLVDLVISIAL